MSRQNRYEYDVAISFAQEAEPVARKLGELLSTKNRKVFYDKSESAELGGGGFVTHIAELYRTRAQYCLMLISKHYPLEQWTASERTFAQQHALRASDEFILPVQLADKDVPGIGEAKGYRDLRKDSMESLVDWLDRKLNESEPPSGPPEESHDLRSGNLR